MANSAQNTTTQLNVTDALANQTLISNGTTLSSELVVNQTSIALSTAANNNSTTTEAPDKSTATSATPPTSTFCGPTHSTRAASKTTARPGRNSTTTTRRAASPPRSSTTRRGSTKRTPSSARPKNSTQLDESVQDWMTNYLHTTPRPYEAKRDCGQRPMQREGRVVGGRDSQLGEFPWSVLIRETSLLGFFVKTKCGGVLIELKWVLTAAHCQPGMFGSLVVVVGEHDLSAKASDRHQAAKPIMRKVKRMIIHRDYNPSNFDNDIALLELEAPFQVQPHVVPICLPEREEQFIGQQALVAGWGKLSFGGPVPKVLQVAKLPVIGNKQCQEMYHNSGHMKLISDSFLCAGYENGGQDSCEGDSGGPLQIQRADGRWLLAGTVSHGIKCAEPNLPGIYIRTAAYLPWIKAVTFHQDHNKRYGPALLHR